MGRLRKGRARRNELETNEFNERNKMKRKIKSWWLAVVSTVCWTGAVFAADIRYVADNVDGEYSGSGYGISVSVSAPATGATIKYAESAMGPWLDELTYKDVCTDKSIYFQITAEGYTTVVDSRTVTITPKALTFDFVWLVLPTEDYVYDGTAKTPDAAYGDGDPSIITPNDFDVAYSDNVNAGTAKAIFIGKGNYTGTVEEEFEILKADNEWTTEPTIAGWTYGQAASEPSSAAKNGTATVTYGTAGNSGGLGTSRPTMPGNYVATFTVAESQNYNALSKDVPFTIEKATINYIADGSTGEYCGIGYGITVTVSTPSSGVTVKYSETDAGPWQDTPVTFKDVCTDKPIYFQIEAEGYKTVSDFRLVTIVPRSVKFSSASANKKYDGLPLISDLVTVGGEGFASGDLFEFDVTGAITDVGRTKNSFTYSPARGTLAQNYNITIDEGILEVSKRLVTLTSATASKKFDGTPLVERTVSVSGDGWAQGENASYSVSGVQTSVGSSLNDFTYTLTNGAKEENYLITIVEGKLTVTEGDIVYTAEDCNAVYDGNGHSILVNPTTPSGLVPRYSLSQNGSFTDVLPTFTNVCNDVVVWYVLEADQYEAVTNFAKVTIKKCPLESRMINAIADQRYTGLEITPKVGFADIGNRKIIPSDYTLTYSNNRDVGQGAVKVAATAQGNYSGEVIVYFNITKASYDMSKAKWSSDAGFVYDGTEKIMSVSGLPDGVTVASYLNNQKVHAGNYTASVVFNYDFANYEKPELTDKTWSIGKRSVTIKSHSASKAFDGTPLVKHGVDVISGSFVPGEGLDYTYTGSQTVVGESPNSYTYMFKRGTLESDYSITKLDGVLAVVAGGIVYTAQGYSGEYDGEGHFIDVCVSSPVGITPKYSLEKSGPYIDALPTFTNACEDVEVWYLLEADGYASITNMAKVSITPRLLTSAMVNDIADETYTGSAIIPDLSFTDEGSRKIEADDYTAIYSDNTNVGTASVKITGRRNYKGEAEVSFNIIKADYDMSRVKWDYTSAFTYDKTEKSVSVIGLPAGVTVKEIVDGKKIHAGNYTAKVTFNYDTDNYNEPKIANCEWVINKKPLSVTADSKIQVFGKAALPLTYRAPALCKGDSLSGSLIREAGSNVGKYAIKLGSLSNVDYAISFIGAIYEIIKADASDGTEPGSGIVPQGGVSKFDASFVYDGKGHTIDMSALIAAFGDVMVGASEIEYAADDGSGGDGHAGRVTLPWGETAPVYTNAGEYIVWYRVTNPNYNEFIHAAKLVITPRDIAGVTVAQIDDIEFADSAVTPTPVVTDGTPSIITTDDYSVSYLNNAKPGAATVVLTGKRNYTGTKSIAFTIKVASVKFASLKGELAWKLNMGSGCYTAQLKLTCTNGFDKGISDLKFVYQDRMKGGKISSGLWDSSTKVYRPTMTIGSTTYRYVILDASKITQENVMTLYGVVDVSQSVGVVSKTECIIELFVSDLSSPVSDIGYIMWKSNGAQCSLPISAVGGSQGMTVSSAMLKTMRMASSVPSLSSPLSTDALNTSLALGVVVDPASSPYCKLTDFTVTPNGLSGRVEVGKETRGVETQGALGTNARAVLLGAKNLPDGCAEIGSVSVDESGSFEFYLGSTEYYFFRVKIEIENVVE